MNLKPPFHDLSPEFSLEEVQKLPKVELHCHLTASFPRSAFKKLLEKKQLDTDISFLDSFDVTEIFTTTFQKIKLAITHKEDLEFVCKECFKAYFDDNVKYLEVRSTPKDLQDIDSIQYVQTIIEEIKTFQEKVEDEMTIR